MMSTDIWGIDRGYEDALGVWQDTPPATHRAILAAMGIDAAAPPERSESLVQVVRPGQTLSLRSPADLILEDGTVVRVETALPPDIPFGYHTLRPLNGTASKHLIMSPGQCGLPPRRRQWGWAVQLYATRSAKSWGIGDFADLRRLAEWSATTLQANLLMVNPLYAATPGVPQQSSPYFPSSRRYRNLLYLRIEEIPGAGAGGDVLERLASAGVALNRERRIDRDAIYRLKLEALEHLWRRFAGNSAFERYGEEQGEDLHQFATFCALAEQHGQKWRQWPAEYRHPESLAVAHFATQRRDRVRFYQWVQWLLDTQLAQATTTLPVMQDLPIGCDPDGADAWTWQDLLATEVTVGAPPDEYNTLGQDWGLPPFIPHKLRAAAYLPFRQTIQASLRHAAGLRIDHVMGLFRLFWIPRDAEPSMGAFVRYPADDLLAILALESHRAQAFVVGEDLGTVEEEAREQLAEHRVLSYRLLWFESDPPSHYPEQALAAVTTHDLPTIVGLWSGADVQTQHELGLQPNEEGLEEIRRQLQVMTGLPEEAEVDEVILRAHELLAQAPSTVITATLEDALAVAERPNMPSTTTEWPNWSMALPLSLEAIERDPLVQAVGLALNRRDTPTTEVAQALPENS
jgi:4-alpha-glucanotransferase